MSNARNLADSVNNPSVSTGTVVPLGGTTVPTGWLECDGSAVSRTTYANLFTAIGTTYGVGDGSTTFNLPDLRGEFIRGWDNGKGTDSGRTFGSSQTDAFQAHKHTYTTPQNYDDLVGGSGSSARISSTGQTTGYAADGANGTPRTASETRPRNIALMYCIKT